SVGAGAWAAVSRSRVALGCDHAGFQLKEALRHYLENAQITLSDLGANSAEVSDYPDYARAVGEAVAGGRCELGILICGTGIGMSMAANKIPGVRAALVFDEQMAALARQHNNANVLCLGATVTAPERAQKILQAFLAAQFDGGRHEQRLSKMEQTHPPLSHRLTTIDPDVANAIFLERQRQQENIELIASENFVSPAVMEAQGSVLTNKYAEGYPGKRWYGGCEFIDVVEQLAIDRAKKLFGAEHVNVQPHSGSGANMAVYFAVLKPGDKMLTMDLTHGG